MRMKKGRLKMKTLRNTGFTFSDDLCVLPLIGDEVSQR